ncbi:hypothetical protein [Pontibacter sp. H249]|uniref:hypothetical protein n=1 Tax=Pontibacter sp. H249 TaxID=3133420 RepID=UPI0030C22D61
MKQIEQYLVVLCFLGILWLTGCARGTTPTGSAGTTTENVNRAPQRVDIRGQVITSRYSDGQVILEVERLSPSPQSRYDRAYVLVLPTAQMVGANGQSISISEFQQGQTVAILLRGGGQGSRVGLGIARKIWVEDSF